MKSSFKKIRLYSKSFLNLIYPLHCPVCQRKLRPDAPRPVCETCWQSVELTKPPFCVRCGRPLEWGEKSVCKSCYGISYHFQEAYSASSYEGVIQKSVHLLKYRKKLSLVKPLGELLVKFYAEHLEEKGFDLLIPVPLHSVRQREREFNQAAVLANSIARRFKIALLENNLRRTRRTKPQTELKRFERLNNLKDAFKVKKPLLIGERAILLVDDVFTTGSTLNECAFCLRRAGAAKVGVLTLARAV